MKKYDYLIVGSGLFGATFAHLAHKQGKTCLVIDKRPHLGGNIYCENIEGINVHKYGATSSIHPTKRCGTSSTLSLSSTATPTRLWQTTKASSTTCPSI